MINEKRLVFFSTGPFRSRLQFKRRASGGTDWPKDDGLGIRYGVVLDHYHGGFLDRSDCGNHFSDQVVGDIDGCRGARREIRGLSPGDPQEEVCRGRDRQTGVRGEKERPGIVTRTFRTNWEQRDSDKRYAE